MKTRAPTLLLTLMIVLTGGAHLRAQGHAFTYQGRFTENGVPYTGSAEFQPTLWDAASGGSQLAANSPVQVVAAGLKGGHVRAVVITHAHDDHFGGAGALASWSRAPIWAHVATATEVEDPWGGFARPGGVFPNTTMADWTNYQSKAGAPARVARLLREGDVIEHEGLGLEVLHTPGHDRSEIALFERRQQWVFSGDLIQLVKRTSDWEWDLAKPAAPPSGQK